MARYEMCHSHSSYCHVVVHWVRTRCKLVVGYQHFGGTHCLHFESTMTRRLRARIMEREDTDISKQWLNKHDTASTDMHATNEELLDAVFSMRSV
jgi:hypothetical protein